MVFLLKGAEEDVLWIDRNKITAELKGNEVVSRNLNRTGQRVFSMNYYLLVNC